MISSLRILWNYIQEPAGSDTYWRVALFPQIFFFWLDYGNFSIQVFLFLLVSVAENNIPQKVIYFYLAVKILLKKIVSQWCISCVIYVFLHYHLFGAFVLSLFLSCIPSLVSQYFFKEPPFRFMFYHFYVLIFFSVFTLLHPLFLHNLALHNT